MKHRLPCLALGLLAALTGCSGFSDTLGFGRNQPDEFAVVDRPPLALPPDFDLRPPRPGAPRPQEVSMNQRANTALFGTNGSAAKPSTATASSGLEKKILTATGAENTDPSIREVVDRESAQKVVGNRHLVDELLWWRDPAAAQAAVVDAPAEAERLKEAKEKETPVNEGATPIIERQKNGWLGL